MTVDEQSEAQSPFDYLSGLTREAAAMLSSRDFVVLIRKVHRDGNQPAVSVTITRFNNTTDPGEIYLINRKGLQDMHFRHPPIVGVPPAPVDFPANMSDKEINDLVRLRAEKVVEFVKTVVGSRTTF